MKSKYLGFYFLLGLLLAVKVCLGTEKINAKADTTDSRYEKLKTDIEKVVAARKGLCAAITLINQDGSAWSVGFGNTDIKRNIPADENTVFRTASLSKMFVALALLKLAEEKKLSLNDKIRDIIPEIEYQNPWETTDPVRIVHLLEHTSGWDEMHLVEMVNNDPKPLSLKEALEFHPHSRTSRWVPGTRKAYCNAGYAVAADIEEKITGLEYDDYVKEVLFKPLGISNSTFYSDSIFQKQSAPLYNWAMKPIDYKHVIYRPAGAMNSSVKDMGKLLQLLLSRGSTGTLALFDANSILRMESPKSTPGARAGLELGYGLANFTSTYKGFVYHGHDGAIDGGLSELAYIPEYAKGHVILMNANDGQVMSEISALIREFEVESLKGKDQNIRYTGEIDIKEGYYVAINPRSQDRFYQDMIIDIHKIEVFDNHITKSWIIPGDKTTFYPESSTTFREEKTDKVGLVEAIDPLAGKVLYTDTLVLKPIPAVIVFSQLFLLIAWIFSMAAGLLIAGIILILALIKKKKYKYAAYLYIFPNLATLMMLLMIILPRLGLDNYNIMLSKPGILSVSLMLGSVLFVLSSVISVWLVLKWRKQTVNKLIYFPVMTLSCLHLLVSIYLIAYRVIPVISWA